jgi:hypothetical protein
MRNPNTSWLIPLDLSIPDSGRWVQVMVCGALVNAWLQAKAPNGFWVQIDSDGPFRLVSQIH